jgi:AraC family transcriptional regulator
VEHILANNIGAATQLPAWRFKRVVAYIDANLHRSLKSCQLAALCDLSVSHFTRVFKQSAGLSPRHFILQRRIEAACHEMLATEEALTTLAHACGFSDQAHLSRSFHLYMGATPLVWRRTQLAVS